MKINLLYLKNKNIIMKKLKFFLGGTTNNTNWRDKLIPKLKIDYFNPVVDELKNM